MCQNDDMHGIVFHRQAIALGDGFPQRQTAPFNGNVESLRGTVAGCVDLADDWRVRERTRYNEVKPLSKIAELFRVQQHMV